MEVVKSVLQGGCKCGEVAFEIRGKPIDLVQCACIRCCRSRRVESANTLIVERADFHWLSGESRVIYTRPLTKDRDANNADAPQASCRRCGSELPRVHLELPVVLVPASSLHSDPGMEPSTCETVTSTTGWFEVTYSLPQYADAPPGG